MTASDLTHFAAAIRTGVVAARNDHAHAMVIHGNRRKVFLDDMLFHGGYLQGTIPQQAYVRTMTKLTKGK